MTVAIAVILWLLLFAIFWPLAIAALLLVPVFWLLSIPFRLVFWVIEAVLRLVKEILFLPARLFGFRKA